MTKSDQVLLCDCDFVLICSVIKHHELLPSVIRNNDSYSPDHARSCHCCT